MFHKKKLKIPKALKKIFVPSNPALPYSIYLLLAVSC